MPPLLEPILACLSLCGIRFVFFGFRDRAIDNHPICGKCRFDLIGRAAGSNRCPKCGSDLLDYDAIKFGNRRQPGLIYSGLGIVLLFGLPRLATIAISTAKVDSIKLKPVSWLLHDATSGTSQLRVLDHEFVFRNVPLVSGEPIHLSPPQP